MVVGDDLSQVPALVDALAPEHLQIATDRPREIFERVSLRVLSSWVDPLRKRLAIMLLAPITFCRQAGVHGLHEGFRFSIS